MDKFTQFWENYPRRSGIGAARQAWQCQIFFRTNEICSIASIKNEDIQDYIIEASKQFSIKHRDTQEQFIPLPKTFLNEQTFLDEDLHKKEQVNPAWIDKISKCLGNDKTHIFKNCTFDGKTLKAENPAIAQTIRRHYETHLTRIFGEVEIVV